MNKLSILLSQQLHLFVLLHLWTLLCSGCACPHGRPSWPREGLGLWARSWVDRVRVVGLLVRNCVEDLWACWWGTGSRTCGPGDGPRHAWASRLVGCGPGAGPRHAWASRLVGCGPVGSYALGCWIGLHVGFGLTQLYGSWTSFSLQKLQILIPLVSSTTLVLR